MKEKPDEKKDETKTELIRLLKYPVIVGSIMLALLASQWFLGLDFSQITDQEVLDLLQRAWQRKL